MRWLNLRTLMPSEHTNWRVCGSFATWPFIRLDKFGQRMFMT